MRSSFLFVVLFILLSYGSGASASDHGWDGWTAELETELAQEPDLVFTAGPTIGFTYGHVGGTAGALFSHEPVILHAEGRLYPFLWDTLRPYAWFGGYTRLSEHSGLDGGIGLALAYSHIHLSLTLGLEHEFETEPDHFNISSLLGLALGWHL